MKGKADKADQPLSGSAIAILVSSGFEETEMTEPQRALLKAGAMLQIVSPDQGLVNGWHGKSWGHFFPIDRQIGTVLGSDFDMLLIPGGERSIGKLVDNPHTKRIIGHFFDAGKPVAAVGQGVHLLLQHGKVKGRVITGPEEIKPAATEAGAQWSEEPVAVDTGLVTAQSAEDLTAFVDETLRVFGEAVQLKKAA